MEAAEEILCKIEINKHKPELESVVKTMLPAVVRLLSDQNFKLVLVALRILENTLESSYFRPDQADILVPALIDKLADPKISVRQNVFKLVRLLLRTTDKDMWLEAVLSALSRGANQFQKDELFNLLQNIYDDYGTTLKYPYDTVLREIAPFM